MAGNKVQPIFGELSSDELSKSTSVAYTESIAYDVNGEVIYDTVKKNRYRNGRGFVISYTEKVSDFLTKVSTGSIVRVFLYVAHHQSYGQGGCFGMRCTYKYLSQVLHIDRTTLWDAMKYLTEKNLVTVNRVDGCLEFMVNPDYITIGADKKLREREWVRRRGGQVIDSANSLPVVNVEPSPKRRRAPVDDGVMN